MRSISFLLLAFFALTIFSDDVPEEEYSVERLQAMGKEELEKICLVRGFEIMRDEIDPSTGLPYELSHDDFVEAARRCLEIEQEMNELLAEYPELATEIEQEIQKLEAEQTAKRAEVQQLEKTLAEAQSAAATAKGSSGAAFVPPTATATAGRNTIVEQDDLEVMDDGDILSNGYDDEGVDESVANGDEDDIREESLNNAKDTESLDIVAKNETAGEDYTMSAVTFEIIRAMIKQVESDVKRIVELLAPVVQPIFRAGDVAWRHLKVVFESLRRSSQRPEDASEVQLTDSVPA